MRPSPAPTSTPTKTVAPTTPSPSTYHPTNNECECVDTDDGATDKMGATCANFDQDRYFSAFELTSSNNNRRRLTSSNNGRRRLSQFYYDGGYDDYGYDDDDDDYGYDDDDDYGSYDDGGTSTEDGCYFNAETNCIGDGSGSDNYGNYESCSWTVLLDTGLRVEEFDTEYGFDYVRSRVRRARDHPRF